MSAEPRCNQKVPLAQADAAVWGGLVAAFTNADELRKLLSEYQDQLRTVKGIEDLTAMERQAAKLRAREDRCLTMMLDADLADDLPVLKAKHMEAKLARITLDQRISEAKVAQDQLESAEAWIGTTVAVLGEYLASVEDAQTRQEIVRSLVERADWNGSGELRMTCFFGSKFANASARCIHFLPNLKVFVSVRLAA